MNKVILTFLKDLDKNNNRDWFQANKASYDEARIEFEDFINSLIPAVAKFDDSVRLVTAKDSIFRIYRDVRFAKDGLSAGYDATIDFISRSSSCSCSCSCSDQSD